MKCFLRLYEQRLKMATQQRTTSVTCVGVLFKCLKTNYIQLNNLPSFPLFYLTNLYTNKHGTTNLPVGHS